MYTKDRNSAGIDEKVTNCYYQFQSVAYNSLLLTFLLDDLTYFYIFEIQSICGRLEQMFCVNLYIVCFLS